MRQTETDRGNVHNLSRPAPNRRRLARTLRIAAVALGLGMMANAHIAHAQDSDDDDSTFEEKIIKNIMTGIGATDGSDSGIDYRERSPLVIPPKIDLPPPQSAAAEAPANWPKDAEAAERRRIRAAEKKRVMGPDGARPLTPA